MLQYISFNYSSQAFGSTTTFNITGLPAGWVYVNVHPDYGLKGTTNYVSNGRTTRGPAALDATTLAVRIPYNVLYTFSDSNGGGATTQSENVFKRDP